MSTTHLYLLRHGETVWNRQGNRYCGWTDVPLSEVGREQAHQVARSLAAIPFVAAYSSPLQRARETAEIIAEKHGLGVVTEQRLVEIDFGAWEGKTRPEIERDDAEGWAAWLDDPTTTRAGRTGETAQQAYERIAAFVREAPRLGQAVLVVGHNTVNRLFIAGTLGMPLRNYRRLTQDNTGINVLELKGDARVWRRINETVHLRS